MNKYKPFNGLCRYSKLSKIYESNDRIRFFSFDGSFMS